MLYSKITGGFYNPAIHTPDQIPADAVEISHADYVALLDAQTKGRVIQADHQGFPISVEPPALSAADQLKAEMVALEATITPRRIREALLGEDGGWLANVNEQIGALRGQLAP